MKITIKGMGQEPNVDYEIEPTKTVGDLKRQISSRMQIDVAQLNLVYGGKSLQDDVSLESYQIKPNDIIHLVLRLRGGIIQLMCEIISI